jgi:uncharacterized protein YcfJ
MQMSRKIILSSLASGAVLLSATAFADSPYRSDSYDSEGYDYARVVDVDPLTRQVRIDTPRRECYEQTRYRDDNPAQRRGTAGSTILGALIGAGIGNSIGSGDGRRVATVAGAIIGSAVGHDVGERRHDRDYAYGSQPVAYTQQRCDVRYETSYQERIDGYRVTYEYNGQRYVTQLPYDPGKRLRIRVNVEPAPE